MAEDVVTATPVDVRVFDDVLVHPLAYRLVCLAQPVQSMQFGPDTFHGIAMAPNPALELWVRRELPWFDPRLTFLRRSTLGQVEPNLIHDDAMMGQWTGILYLNPDPPEGDGTILYDPETVIAARFNRLLVFPSARRHARAIPEHYGTTPETARLVQVIFGGDPSWQ